MSLTTLYDMSIDKFASLKEKKSQLIEIATNPKKIHNKIGKGDNSL